MMRRLWLSVLLLCGSALIQADDAWPLLPEAARHWQTQPQTPQQRLLWGSFTYHYLNQDYRAALNVLPSPAGAAQRGTARPCRSAGNQSAAGTGAE